MFTRPAFYHPYKRSTPLYSAGFRITDYINPKRCFNLFRGPDFTNKRNHAPCSPMRGAGHPADDPPPTFRLADLFTGDVFGTNRPSTPAHHHPRNDPASPNVQKTNAHGPFPFPPHRKRKYGPKHLTFNSSALRSGILPPRRRAQQLREKRDAVRRRILDRHERRVARAREGISGLRREAEALMDPAHMNAEDKIFMKQLEALQFNQVLEHDLEQCRQRLSRAANESSERQQEHEKRDEEAARMWGEVQDAEARKEQKRKVATFLRTKEERREARYRRMEEAALRADEERRRVHQARERKIREEQEHLFREQLARKAMEEERRRREEEEHRARLERERQLREEKERQLREERDRLMQEAKMRILQEEIERLRKEAHERFVHEQRERLAREVRERLEREREARLAEQARRAAQDDQVRQFFVLYEGKWNELRTSAALPLIDVQEMPWPVLGVVSSASQITYQDVRTFLFHPLRPGVEGKAARDKVKSEVLRFHPDKFNTRILPKIQPSQQAIAQEIAGAIARIMTRIMNEEAGQQK